MQDSDPLYACPASMSILFPPVLVAWVVSGDGWFV